MEQAKEDCFKKKLMTVFAQQKLELVSFIND